MFLDNNQLVFLCGWETKASYSNEDSKHQVESSKWRAAQCGQRAIITRQQTLQWRATGRGQGAMITRQQTLQRRAMSRVWTAAQGVDSESVYLWRQRRRDFCFHGWTKNTENIVIIIIIKHNYFSKIQKKILQKQILFSRLMKFFVKYHVKHSNSIEWNIQSQWVDVHLVGFKCYKWSKVGRWPQFSCFNQWVNKDTSSNWAGETIET